MIHFVVLVLGVAPPPHSPPPSYSKHIAPLFARYCVGCHGSKDAEGGLGLESYKAMTVGGTRGAAVVPGKADESRLVRMMEGTQRPVMPPAKSPQPTKREVALVRAWVRAGARDDGAAAAVVLPKVAPRRKTHPPVTAVAAAQGKWAASGRDEVLILDGRGEVTGRFSAGRVTALAYSPGAGRLAVASGAVGEAGEVAIREAGERPAVALRHDDVVQSLAFSPDGKLLATAGYDRVVKLFDVVAQKVLHVLKDHSDSVYGVCFSPDGKLLATVAADRVVKVWDVATGARLYTLSESTDWLYCVAWHPDGKRLAAAGVDKSVRVWQVDAKEGKVVHSVFAHEGPVLRLIYSPDGKTLYSLGEDRVVKSWHADEMTERKTYDRQPEAVLSLAVSPDQKQLALGRYDGALVLLDAETGKARSQPLPIKPKPLNERFPAVPEKEPNDSPRAGQPVKLSATVVGQLGRAGDVDWYRFDAKAGEEVGVQVLATKFDPLLKLVGPDGETVAESVDGLLGHVCAKAGGYALGVRDRDYRGGAGVSYRLHVGAVPVVTSAFPLGVRRGKSVVVRLEGVHLGERRTVGVAAPETAAVGSRIAVPKPTVEGEPALGSPALVVGEFADVPHDGEMPLLVAPATGDGVIARPEASQTWRFAAKKGQRLILEVEASRAGSPLDSTLEILDDKGAPLPRAVLRSQARTYSVFRDHDSRSAGIRIEAWAELAVDDHILAGGQLLRIRALPRGPDDDCQFWSEAGQRLGFLGTTPSFVSTGTPMYKVTTHPPGTTFAPNGLPIATLYWRNDDGGPRVGKDSRLAFDAPADGVYRARVADSRGEGSAAHVYRLTARPPRPDFSVSVAPVAAVSKGGAVPVRVSVTRLDEFDGVIDVRLTDLPQGFEAPATNVPSADLSTAVALYASEKATVPAKQQAMKVEARATIDGKAVVRTASGGVPKLAEAGDVATATEQSEVTIRPGGEAKVTVRIERRDAKVGRVPVEVQGLPHGVRVLDVGLNGILIVPGETTRTFVLYAEPWVKPMNHPIVVLARREGKNSEHAAKSVLMRVTK